MIQNLQKIALVKDPENLYYIHLIFTYFHHLNIRHKKGGLNSRSRLRTATPRAHLTRRRIGTNPALPQPFF